jgi:hypothetical protein
VAWVEAVNGYNATIQEYNILVNGKPNGAYRRRTVGPGSDNPSGYIHIKDIVLSKPSTPASASLSPANAATKSAVTASWDAAGGAASYDVSLICTTNAGNNQSSNGIAGTGTSFIINNAGTYKISVVAKNSAGASGARESGTITVHPNSVVTFQDYDGTILKTQSVPYGGNASAPPAPSREGYTFQGWDRGFAGVTGDITVKATYRINRYTVRFVDDKGNLISSQTIDYSGAAVAPTPTPPAGFVFVDWDSHEYGLVKRDLTITAVYKWENPDLPNIIAIESAVRNMEGSGYDVRVGLQNYPLGSTRGRVIVTLKTEEGKMVASETETYNLAELAAASRTVFVPYTGIATRADVSVVGLLADGNTGVPLAGMQTATIDLGLEWSDWSTNPLPSGDFITETRDEYRYRDKSTTSGSSSAMNGWTLVRSEITGWGSWSAWQNSSISASASREVGTQTVPAQTQQMWTYYRYEYWNTGWGAWASTYSSSMGGELQRIYPDNRLGITGWHDGHPAYGPYNFNGRNNTLWWGEEEYTKQTAAAYTQWHYRDAIYTYYFEKWGDWSDWLAGSAPAATDSKQVETRTVSRFKSNEIIRTTYNYKRFKYHNLSDGNEYYAYSSAYAGSMGYPGEWEHNPSQAELAIVATVDGNVALYNGYGSDSWYRADVNVEGSAAEYVTFSTMEDASGTERTVFGAINAPGKLATMLVFRRTNEDPTASQLEYVDQATLSESGGYSFAFKTKDEPSARTGDFIVMLAVEGGTSPVYVSTIAAPPPIYSVVFTDIDGAEISRQSVIEGQAAVLPAPPEKEGYDFAGWDESTSNVRRDLAVSALYEKQKFNVIFVDWDNTDIAIREFEYGEPLHFENIPEKEGSAFAGWSTLLGEDVVEVKQNMTVTAKYSLNSYSVKFLGWDGATLSEQTVEYGGEAEAPAISAPPTAGFLFKSWSNEQAYAYVTEDLTLTPVPMFEETVSMPAASLAGGDYQGAQTISLSCGTEGAKIYFTTDGTVPVYEKTELGTVVNGNLYYSPLTVSEDTMLLAMAFADGKNNSELTIERYSIGEVETQPVEPVSASPSGGTVEAGTLITLHTETEGAVIRYTVDGSEPTEYSQIYSSPIALAADTTIKAKAFKEGMEPSATSEFLFTVATVEPPDGPDAPALAVGRVTGLPGDEALVAVTLSNNPGIAGFKFRLHFDNSKLLPVDLAQGEALTVGAIVSNLQSGVDLSTLEFVSANWANASNFYDDGVICTVRFIIKDGANEGGTPITLTYETGDITDQVYSDIELAVSQGEVNIITLIFGNIFSDGDDTAVNSKDAVKLAQYLADWPTISLTDRERLAADVYADGVVNSKDAVKLAQYLADWPGIVLGAQ